jgi:hypothetical protein
MRYNRANFYKVPAVKEVIDDMVSGAKKILNRLDKAIAAS